MNKLLPTVLSLVFLAGAFLCLVPKPCPSFPLIGGEKFLEQDVLCAGGRQDRTGGPYTLEDDVIGQPALIGNARESGTSLAHGYLGGGLSGVSVGYLRSTIKNPLPNMFVDALTAITGLVTSPIQVREEQILLECVSDGMYFNGTAWQAASVWLTCSGTTFWLYSIQEDNKVFTYGLEYRLSARATDIIGSVEDEGPTILFTYVYSTGLGSSLCNYPNPFYPVSQDSSRNRTTIEYFLRSPGKAMALFIYAINGELVRKWSGVELATAGLHRIVWDGRNEDGAIVGSGTYLLIVDNGSEKAMEKIAVIQ